MENNMTTYDLGMGELVNELMVNGGDGTSFIEGDMGSGKSALLNMLAEKLPDFTPIYCDMVTKDVGDLAIPMFHKLEEGGNVVSFATNEELGVHLEGKIILLMDEFGKASAPVQNACLRLMQERKFGPHSLHEESIVFATTNLGAENVGDLIKPHARNRVTFYRLRKATPEEFNVYMINNQWNPAVISWVAENPSCLQSFTQVADPKENPYIYHPKLQRNSFVTQRSLERASKHMDKQDLRTEVALTAALIGTVGQRAGMELVAYASLIDQLPKLQEIKDDPYSAKVPEDAAAICLVVFRVLGCIERDWMDSWMTYMNRLPKQGQTLFANQTRVEGYARKQIVVTHKKFQTWALDNRHLFSADKR